MPSTALFILIFAFILAKIFQKKSSKYLKEEYKRTFWMQFARHPYSYLNKAYFDKKGVQYRNLALMTWVVGLIIFFIIIISNQ